MILLAKTGMEWFDGRRDYETDNKPGIGLDIQIMYTMMKMIGS